MIRTPAVVRRAGQVGMIGAAIQLVYGLMAVAFPYPAILDPQWEVLWAVANLGMVAGVVAWHALDVARPRTVAAIGAGLTVLGLLSRVVISIVLIVRRSTEGADGPIVATILMTFIGLTVLWICTLTGRRLTGPQASAPALVVAVGLVTASLYSANTVLHFILLGLAWGLAWMVLSLVAYRQVAAARSPALAG